MSAVPVAVRLSHDLPAPAIEVVPLALVEQVEIAVAEASQIRITDAASFEAANALVVRLHQADKAVESHGEKIKKPLNQLLKAVRDCLDRAATPVQNAKRELQAKIFAWTREQQRIAEAARAKAEAEERAARAAAEAERARLQAEADAKHAAEVAAAKAKAQADADAFAEVIGVPVEAAPVIVAPAPVVIAAPVAIAAPVIPQVQKSAVSVRKVKKLEIYDAAAVPVSLGGIDLRPIDQAAVKRALDSGIAVPGARMIEVEEMAMARGPR